MVSSFVFNVLICSSLASSFNVQYATHVGFIPTKPYATFNRKIKRQSLLGRWNIGDVATVHDSSFRIPTGLASTVTTESTSSETKTTSSRQLESDGENDEDRKRTATGNFSSPSGSRPSRSIPDTRANGSFRSAATAAATPPRTEILGGSNRFRDSKKNNSGMDGTRNGVKRDVVNYSQTQKQEQQQPATERLTKARKMLDEYLLMDPSPTTTAAATATATSSVSKDGSAMDDDGGEVQQNVPDTFWTNGHLEDGKGDFVTRWAKGVKVAEPLRKYDPVAAEKLLFRQPTKWVVRNIQIAFPLGMWAAGVIFDIISGNELSNRRNRAKQLQQTVSGLGPAIIKGGQALASRSDLLPSEYLDELQKLQDDVPRFSDQLALDTVEYELGVRFEEVFELIGAEPVAAASIGQVYKARLLSNGDTVALKIQRPKCEEIIALDLYVLRWWSGIADIIISLIGRDINVQSIIDDFGELIYRELDYVAEAANAQRFSELYSDVTDVFVPKVYSDLTTSKVLTMEWVDGFRLTDSGSLKSYGLDRRKLVNTLVQCSLRQILENGFFHADPHAGNLLACNDGRLCYLDFGMMSYAATSQRNGFLLVVVHIVNRDWTELVRLYQRLGFIPEGTDLRPIEVALEDALPDVLNAEVSELNFKNVVGKLGDIMYTYPFSLPPFYIAIIRCLGVLEGLAIQVDPRSRIISKAYPYVANRVLTDPQDELQEALRRLALTSDGHIRWNRLEGLLEEAKGSEGYDVTVAMDQLTDYLISDDGEQLLSDLVNEIVEGADSLGAETVGYISEASRALLINDEVAAVKAFRSLESLFSAATADAAARQQNGKKSSGENNISRTQEQLMDGLAEVLPEPTASMKQVWRIVSLLVGTSDNSENEQQEQKQKTNTDPTKFLPLVRKLGQEPRVQRAASEIVARLGERVLSRTLRAVFGLPPPDFFGLEEEAKTASYS